MDRRLRLDAYAWMSLTRAFDETMVSLWKQGGGVGGTFSERGHEAISVGVGLALAESDVVAPMHRDLGTYLVRGMTPERIFGNLLGRAMGVSGGRDANLHGMGDLSLGVIGFVSHLPQSLPTTLGVAMAFRHRRQHRAALTFVGDGGSTSGLFHEVLNMAALWRAPFVLVVENNKYAYSTPLDQQMPPVEIWRRAAGYGIDARRVDGNDVEAIHQAAVEALERARGGGGPSVIEADTMRMLGHAIHDGAEYVPPELIEEWSRRDPLAIARGRLIEDGVTEATLDSVDADAKKRVAAALRTAQEAPLPDPATLLDGVFAP